MTQMTVRDRFQCQPFLNASNALKMQTEGTTYYVDARDGNDTADGKTEDTAWKSFDRVNSKTFFFLETKFS